MHISIDSFDICHFIYDYLFSTSDICSMKDLEVKNDEKPLGDYYQVLTLNTSCIISVTALKFYT